jgi:hypothetical protein
MPIKGQASVEYLILFATSLAVVLIVINALTVLSDSVGQYNEKQRSLLARDALFSAARDACYIGDGTSFVVELGDTVNVTTDRINGLTYSLPCELEPGAYRDRVLVENEGNKIKIG